MTQHAGCFFPSVAFGVTGASSLQVSAAPGKSFDSTRDAAVTSAGSCSGESDEVSIGSDVEVGESGAGGSALSDDDAETVS